MHYMDKPTPTQLEGVTIGRERGVGVGCDLTPLMAASATFALKAGVWFWRGRLLMVSPESQGTACPLSGRNSTYRPVQISGTSSLFMSSARS